MDNSEYITRSKDWVKDFVIVNGLCPFAYEVFANNRIEWFVISENDRYKQLIQFWEAVCQLETTNPKEISTSLLIYPRGLDRFEDYLNLYHTAEDLLIDKGKDNLFQLASFHPNYQFGGVEPEAAENYTNRSPFPMIHLLRVEEVAEAIEQYPDTNTIPDGNIEKMNALGINQLIKIFKKW